MFARCYQTAGITNTDRIQITPGYGLWTAGIGFQAGCEKLGAMAIPMGPGNTDKQLQMMIDLKSTVICATSSYALLLSEEIGKRGLKDQIFLKKGVIGSERWSEKMRNTIKRNLGINLYDIYGLTEIYGPGIGISCDENNGMHYWDDYIYIEIIDPETGKRVEDGQSGEIVITTLVKEGAPLLRFRTHDLSRIIPVNVPAAASSQELISSQAEVTICSRSTVLTCSQVRLNLFLVWLMVLVLSIELSLQETTILTRMFCTSVLRQKVALILLNLQRLFLNLQNQNLV